ncbi:phospholipid-transporting ATPase ABCA3-like [Dermacentor albipictus]|uniref:phospholipid-transporting ATPase ABCA3-like n=1 Tax=Dermacentor albipictus TaxID=60249 RepID=UPI0031FCF994
MGLSWTHLWLLVWKCYVIVVKRHWVAFIMELVAPAAVSLTLVFSRQYMDYSRVRNVTYFEPFPVQRLPPRFHVPPPSAPRWLLLYAPDTNATAAVLGAMAENSNPPLMVQGFETEEAMVNHYMAAMAHRDSILGGVVFVGLNLNASGTLPLDINFKIRLKAAPRMRLSQAEPYQSWSTDSNFPMLPLFSPRHPETKFDGSPGYVAEGFLYLQQQVFKHTLEFLQAQEQHYSDEPPPVTHLRLQRFPLPPHTVDSFYFIVHYFLPIIVLLSYIYPSLAAVRQVGYEKESGMKDLLEMMGVNPWLNYAAWFLTTLAVMTASSGLLVIVVTAPLSSHGPVLRNSDPVVFFLLLVAYSASSTSFSFFVGSFFNKANTSVAALAVAYITTFSPFLFFFSLNDDHTLPTLVAGCLLCNTALPVGITVTTLLEASGDGIQWHNLDVNPSPGQGLSLMSVILLLVFDTFMYIVVLWYVEVLAASQPRISWRLSLVKPEDHVPTAAETEKQENMQKENAEIFFEEFASKEPAGVRLVNLTKVYGKTTVVSNINLEASKGYITVLLGHNGAGKTTTMRMITGQLTPSSGSVFIEDQDVSVNSRAAHQGLGLCPQNDIHFLEMTVFEHLYFFSRLKKVPYSDVHEQTFNLLVLMNMVSKTDTFAKHLSGGMKRKLSIAMALIGHSKVVILDEPTAGMDPAARRDMWDLLLSEKAQRTILLTTHSMEEADAIGDRIAIMANGIIQCCGSPFFLKKNLGAGYHMAILKTPNCDPRAVMDEVAAFAPSAELESNVGAEMALRIGRGDQPVFKHLFSHLEENKEKLGIASFGVSVTTLEEVFLRVGDYAATAMSRLRMPEPDQLRDTEADTLLGALHFTDPLRHGSRGDSSAPPRRNGGSRLLLQQTWGLLVLHSLHSRRNWAFTLSQLLVPVFVVAYTLTWIDSLPKVHKPGPRVLDVNQVFASDVPYAFHGGASASLAKQFKKQFSSKVTPILVEAGSVESYLVNASVLEGNTFLTSTLIAASFEDEEPGSRVRSARLLFNNQVYHTPALAMAAYQRALLHETFDNASLKLTVVNHPFPRVVEEKANKLITMHRESFQIGQQTIFGTSFLIASFSVFLVVDHVSNSRHLQRISGLNMIAYWAAYAIWSLLLYISSCLLVMSTFRLFNTQGFTELRERAVMFLLFFYFGISWLPMIAAMSFCFRTHTAAYVRIATVFFAAGVCGLVLVAVLEWRGKPGLEHVIDTVDTAFTYMLPMYALGRAFCSLYRNAHFNIVCNDYYTQNVLCEIAPNRARYCCKDYCRQNECIDWQPDLLSWGSPGIARALLAFILHALLGLAVLCACEAKAGFFTERLTVSGSARRTSVTPNEQMQEDDDVAEEKERVLSSSVSELAKRDVLVLRRLSRVYGSFCAVHELSFGVRKGECFGLLGINGAGKTTTFNMLTATIGPSAGEAFVDGYSVTSDTKQVRRRIGYCPQTDALPGFLTGREVLTLYARIRGIPENRLGVVCRALAQLFYFTPHLDSTLDTYSGGNKRKVSTAVAFMGSPQLVILDEPSTGMDPVAKRCVWNTLQELIVRGCSIILTSHSMEECEAMCSRLAIMVNGRLCCLGSPQHLKNKFGSGYSIMIKVAGAKPSATSLTSHSSFSSKDESLGTEVDGVKNYMQARLPGIELIGAHNGLLEFHLSAPDLSWAEVFDVMDQAKGVFNVADYSVAQLTLEQVFLHFAMLQREDNK